ncbi:WD40 repeat-like protein [Sistotremastrum suecicum HHB10207 ss-3]|uniref:WD40 repeat-like protein n=1 Tax=Sistotremastrum suecicum HHB10207 ss-3 TaxID=1314776 RepID=A0A166BYC8_9AGAM|nr:WD40 repeat-like protein [Sistotremastrum suecicum HHB10207 ss-3]
MLDIDDDHETPAPASFSYMRITSPPTPEPSPSPQLFLNIPAGHPTSYSSSDTLLAMFAGLDTTSRGQFLSSLLPLLTASELSLLSAELAPRLKRDFLTELPTEIALHILSFVDDPRTLARASEVSRSWRVLLTDEQVWKRECEKYAFASWLLSDKEATVADRPGGSSSHSSRPSFSYREHLKESWLTEQSWRRGGHISRTYQSPDGGIVTSVAMDSEWIVVALANSRIHVFCADTGVLTRTLVGHESGVWAVNLVSRGGYMRFPKSQPQSPSHSRSTSEPRVSSAIPGSTAEGTEPRMIGLRVVHPPASAGENIPTTLRASLGLTGLLQRDVRGVFEQKSDREPKPSDPRCASQGWGQGGSIVVSGGCDKVLRVWDLKSGYCLYILHGHRSTVRCVKVLHNRPIAVSGSRDTTLRVWDVMRGKLLRTLTGHEDSVRCLDVCDDQVVSGSYDCTCRLWDVDTGECLRVFKGHSHQIYSVSFDGVRIASGGLDTFIYVWSAATGQCEARLSGHTALVCQVQFTGNSLASGGADGRILSFLLPPSTPPTKSIFAALTPSTSSTTTPPSPIILPNPDPDLKHPAFEVLGVCAAHESSVTSLQLEDGFPFVISGGNDGRVRIFERYLSPQSSGADYSASGSSQPSRRQQFRFPPNQPQSFATPGPGGSRYGTGVLVRDLGEKCEAVWKILFGRNGRTLVVFCKRQGRTVMEIWRFGPGPNDHTSDPKPAFRPKKTMKRRSVSLKEATQMESEKPGSSVMPLPPHIPTADADVDMDVDHDEGAEGVGNIAIELEHPRTDPAPVDPDLDSEDEEADEIVIHDLQ